MNVVCEVCGDIGYRHLLLCCRDCNCSATHQYCLENVVYDASLIEWLCYECLQRRREITCIRSLEKVPCERPPAPSHAHFGSIIHQPITKRVESARDAWSRKNRRHKLFLNKYASVNKIYSSRKKLTKNKANMRPMANRMNRGRVAKITSHTSAKASYSYEIIGTELSKSKNNGANHDNQTNDRASDGCKNMEVKSSSAKENKTVVGVDKNKYRAAGSLRNSADKFEVHGDNNNNIIDSLMPEIEREDIRFQPDYRARYELLQRNMAATVPQLSTLQNDSVDKVMPHSPNDGCEEVLPCPGIKSIPTVPERSVNSIDISSMSQHDTAEASESSERFTKCQKGEDIPSENIYLESNDLQSPLGADYVLSYRTYLSEAQKKRVMMLIQENQPDFTVYVATMRKTTVQPPGPYLGITKEYALAYFPDKSTNITLEMPGKSKKWHIKFYKEDKSRKNFLMGQWLDFVCDNHVQEGDIVLLSPTKGGERSIFVAYVLHETTNSRGGSSAKLASQVHIEEELTTGKDVVQESDMPEIPFEYIVPCKNYLSKSQKRIIEERARVIQSEVPLCVAVMKNNNVGVAQRWMLELGSRFGSVYLPTKGQTMVLQCGGKTWETRMMFHNGRRWFINGGWPNFARGNGLRVGDICLFELKEEEEKLTMAVHIIRKEQF